MDRGNEVQGVNRRKEPVNNEDTAAVVNTDADVDHLEEDFEDALEDLTFESHSVANEHSSVNNCCDSSCKHESDTVHHYTGTHSEDASGKAVNSEADYNPGIPSVDVDENLSPSSLSGDEETDDKPEAAGFETVIDEAVLRQREACLTDEQKQSRKEEAIRLKDLGNQQFMSGSYEAAVVSYTDALATCLLCHTVDRAIMYSNRAAAKIKLEKYEDAITDCTKALEFNPDYMKALLRRAELYEKTEKLDEALEDYNKALERDSSLHVARAACVRLPDQIKERNEKMKEEMIGKLKDLGNMVLRPFGLSTNNFKLQQDPTTGSYSVSFQQNPQPQS